MAGWHRILPIGIVLSACVPFSPPPGAIEIDPPPRFERLYSEMESCTGRRGDFQRVRWWMVPGYAFRLDAWLYEALWAPGHHIVLTAWNAYDNDALIRHEIGHDLGYTSEDHSDPVYRRCSGPLRSSLGRERAR